MKSLNKISKARFSKNRANSLEGKEICHSCGGNGYTKSNPNCYQTCLDCLGRGVVLLDLECCD